MKNYKLEFKRITKSEVSNMNWDNVESFLQTWGFLPSDSAVYEKLNDIQKTKLLDLLLDLAWRKESENDSKYIIKVQKLLANFLNPTE